MRAVRTSRRVGPGWPDGHHCSERRRQMPRCIVRCPEPSRLSLCDAAGGSQSLIPADQIWHALISRYRLEIRVGFAQEDFGRRTCTLLKLIRHSLDILRLLGRAPRQIWGHFLDSERLPASGAIDPQRRAEWCASSRNPLRVPRRNMGIVTLTFGGQPEVGDDPAAHIILHFGRRCPGARH